MPASVRLVHRVSKQKKRGGTAPIYLRITKNRRARFISTGVAVKPVEWNDDRQEVNAKNDLHEAYNKKLTRLRIKAEKEVLNEKSADQVKQALAGSAGDFVQYVERFIERRNRDGQFWEARKYEVLLRKCQRCLGKGISWRQLDKDALEKLESYMRTKIGNAPNTVRKEMSRLRRICRQAVRDGELPAADDPFIRYTMPKGNKIDRPKLSLEEIQSLEALDLPIGSKKELIRDAFLFAFYGGGIRFGDLCVLKVKEASDGRVRYKAMKTGSTLSVPLPEQGKSLVDKYAKGKEPTEYLFPLLPTSSQIARTDLRRRISSVNAVANKTLKQLAELAGIEPEGFSTHVARHSFADLARRMGGDVHSIMQALGHSDIKVTQTYLKSLDKDAVDQLAEKMWQT